MKYLPAPKKLIVQYIKPEIKKGVLILPEDEADFRKGLVLSAGEECPSYYTGSYIYYSKYGGLPIDKPNDVYLIDITEIFCRVEEE